MGGKEIEQLRDNLTKGIYIHEWSNQPINVFFSDQAPMLGFQEVAECLAKITERLTRPDIITNTHWDRFKVKGGWFHLVRTDSMGVVAVVMKHADFERVLMSREKTEETIKMMTEAKDRQS